MKRNQNFGVQNEGLGVIAIPNPESRKKIPIKLSQKISDSSSGQTIVGLDVITEYIPVSNDGKLVVGVEGLETAISTLIFRNGASLPLWSVRQHGSVKLHDVPSHWENSPLQVRQESSRKRGSAGGCHPGKNYKFLLVLSSPVLVVTSLF